MLGTSSLYFVVRPGRFRIPPPNVDEEPPPGRGSYGRFGRPPLARESFSSDSVVVLMLRRVPSGGGDVMAPEPSSGSSSAEWYTVWRERYRDLRALGPSELSDTASR